MRAGAEDHAGVEQNGDAVLRILRREPLRHDQKPLTDGQRLIILLPAVFPVLVADVGQRDLKRTEIYAGILRAQRGKLIAELADGLRGGGAVLQIKPDLRQTGHLPLQLLVHIVPILTVLIEKFMEFLLIVYNKAVKAQNRQTLGDQLDRGGGGLDGHFDPLHDNASRKEICWRHRAGRAQCYPYILHEFRENNKRYFTFRRGWSIIQSINRQRKKLWTIESRSCRMSF